MILVLGEDRVLEGYRSPEDVVQAIEPLDAEETIVAAFDESGRPNSIEWVRPNHYGRKWFGLLSTAANGEYRLVPSGPPDVSAALAAIRSASAVEPSANEAVAHLKGIGAEVEGGGVADRNGT